MAVYYIASIAPVFYPAFYDLCGGRLPNTFEEWRVLEDIARRDLVLRGHHVVGVPLEPVVFRDHCRSVNCQTDGVALTALATRIGNERFATAATHDAVRARTVVVEDTRAGPVAVEETTAGPVVVEKVPARRHWWQFWRRPRFVERRVPLAARTA
jgi:hypothetical protein